MNMESVLRKASELSQLLNWNNQSDKLLDTLERFEVNNSTRGALSGTDVITIFVMISPKLAEILLKRNVTNRPFSSTNTRHLVREMRNGNWQFDGQPIRFDKNGKLSDGQHRLKSVIESGLTLPFLVVLGLEEKVFKTMDTGKTRNGSDVFAIAEIPNAKTSAAIAMHVYNFKKDSYGGNKSQKLSLSNTDLLKFYHELDDLQKSVRFAMNANKNGDKLLTPKTIGTLHYLFNEVNSELAEDFLTQLTSGFDIKKNSPVLALRQRLIKSKLDPNHNLTYQSKLEYIFYSWEKFVDNKNVINIKLPSEYKINLDYGKGLFSKN